MTWHNVPAPRRARPGTVGEILESWNIGHRIAHLCFGIVAYAVGFLAAVGAVRLHENGLCYAVGSRCTWRHIPYDADWASEYALLCLAVILAVVSFGICCFAMWMLFRALTGEEVDII